MSHTPGIDWVTNNPEAARKLKTADKQYHNERAKAITLPLIEKVAAFGAAKQRYVDACRAIALDAAKEEEIRRANESAYHGDIDGDFDY